MLRYRFSSAGGTRSWGRCTTTILVMMLDQYFQGPLRSLNPVPFEMNGWASDREGETDPRRPHRVRHRAAAATRRR